MSDQTETPLIKATNGAVSASDILSVLPDATALVYTPTECFFARNNAGRLTRENGGEVDPDSAYELCLFDDTTQLKWQRQGENTGRAVFIAETGTAPDGFEPLAPKATHPEDGEHLLWGEYEASLDQGWSVFSDARIGKLPVPAEAEKGDRAILKFREYFIPGRDGNMVVAAQRLLRVECSRKDDGNE